MVAVNTLLEDDELLERLRAGDASACTLCVQKHSHALYRLALRLVRDESEAEDVVQETFTNAWKALDSFDGRASLGTWLFRIAYNNALMRLRKRGRMIPLASDEDDGDSDEFPAHVVVWQASPEELIERAETAEIMDRTIDSLSQDLRAVFHLREIEERSVAETAQILNVTEEVVKVRLHRARLALRERLSSYFGIHAPSEKRTITCGGLVKYLSDYIDNDLDEPLNAIARRHIETCSHCHVLVDTTEQTIALYKTHSRKQLHRLIPTERRQRLYRELEAAFRKRQPA